MLTYEITSGCFGAGGVWCSHQHAALAADVADLAAEVAAEVSHSQANNEATEVGVACQAAQLRQHSCIGPPPIPLTIGLPCLLPAGGGSDGSYAHYARTRTPRTTLRTMPRTMPRTGWSAAIHHGALLGGV
eukprot:1190814-Prorocentrum_minimum.AAC.5